MFELVDNNGQSAVIKVIGVGGGGGNAVNHMIKNNIEGVEFICANTDAQALKSVGARTVLQLGPSVTKGLGAGTNPEIGRSAALEDRDRIMEVLQGADMVFITTGMGGGTGTGAAPVVAEIAKEMGILTVAVVTRPSNFEGNKRGHIAQNGLEQLKGQVDSLIVIPNDKLFTVLGEDATMREAFRAADDVLRNAVAGISEVVTNPGFINVDFADVKNVMGIKGMAMMGSGFAQGIDRARLATEQAISSPLLDGVTLDGARGVLVNVTTAPGCLKMSEYGEIMKVVNSNAHPDAECKFGTAEDENMSEDAIRVTIIATGLQEHGHQQVAPVRTSSRVQQSLGGREEYAPQQAQQSHNIDGLVRSGRGTRGMNLTAADFGNQSVLDDFEIPAILRRQNSSDN